MAQQQAMREKAAVPSPANDPPARRLFCGDNLEILRRSIPDHSIDLAYLDPPFNSKRAYSLSVHARDGAAAGVQPPVFEDTWQWGEQAEREYGEVSRSRDAEAGRVLAALRSLLQESDTMAYLVMMAARLLELRRVLKPTGSLYLHCDTNASHYLKILLDAVFGQRNFRNEIVWHYYNKYSAGRRIFPRSFDQILFYSAGDGYTFNPQREARDQPVRQLLRENVGGVLKNRKDAAGKTMTRLVRDRKVDAVWRMPCLQYASREYLGYPTQKPLALLERIIRVSSNPGDVVLDPFCGCGTAIHAAESLARGWIGIDAAPVAIALVNERLARAFPGIPLEGPAFPPEQRKAR
jgi:site-specific DNA-methyltransferase (adenine-specific)